VIQKPNSSLSPLHSSHSLRLAAPSRLLRLGLELAQPLCARYMARDRCGSSLMAVRWPCRPELRGQLALRNPAPCLQDDSELFVVRGRPLFGLPQTRLLFDVKTSLPLSLRSSLLLGQASFGNTLLDTG
jgi:hypothetical protein